PDRQDRRAFRRRGRRGPCGAPRPGGGGTRQVVQRGCEEIVPNRQAGQRSALVSHAASRRTERGLRQGFFTDAPWRAWWSPRWWWRRRTVTVPIPPQSSSGANISAPFI